MKDELMKKLEREVHDFKEQLLKKSKEDIIENSYKVAAYEEIFFLFQDDIEKNPEKYNDLYLHLMDTEEVVGLVYLEVLESEYSFPQTEQINDFIAKCIKSCKNRDL